MRNSNSDDSFQHFRCIGAYIIGGPGDELIGAHKHKRCLVALAAIAAAVANDLERNTQRRGGSLEVVAAQEGMKVTL